jgi:hypothetical protein
MTVELNSALTATLLPTESSPGYSSIRRADAFSASTSGSPPASASAAPAAASAAAPAPIVPAPSALGTLQVAVDPQTSQVVVQIVDGTTDEVITKIPAEDVAALAQSAGQTSGVFVNTQA